MISVCCSLEDQLSTIQIYDEKIILKNSSTKVHSFCDIKSVNVKNTEKYLLKVKLDENSYILEFDNLHLRDLVKSIILDKIKVAENIQKSVLSSNIDYSRAYKNIKNVVSDKQFTDSITINKSVYFQTPVYEITPENFFKILNQPLVDVFIIMNCTITQFFNLLVSSYFYDIKNQKNAFDRLISARLREFGTGMDYATRINSLSMFNMTENSEIKIDPKANAQKPIEFEPIYPYKVNPTEYKDLFTFEATKLVADFPVQTEAEEQNFIFDTSDFETARDLCKLMYKCPNEEASKFSDEFVNLIIGKYGKDALRYTSRLLPNFYKK